MSILIKGMKMPMNCGECKFLAWKRGVGNHCAIDENITFHAAVDGFNVRNERKGNCPLIELPPHGRLIDADVLAKDVQTLQKYRFSLEDHDIFVNRRLVMWLIRDNPTIIEAEGTE